MHAHQFLDIKDLDNKERNPQKHFTEGGERWGARTSTRDDITINTAFTMKGFPSPTHTYFP